MRRVNPVAFLRRGNLQRHGMTRGSCRAPFGSSAPRMFAPASCLRSPDIAARFRNDEQKRSWLQLAVEGAVLEGGEELTLLLSRRTQLGAKRANSCNTACKIVLKIDQRRWHLKIT